MQTISFVSTFHKPVLDLYGQRFIDSFSKNIDKQFTLYLYAEDCVPQTNDSRIIILDQKAELPKLVAFKERWKNVPKANGKCPPEIKARRPRDWHKEFKWHAIRFANKVYAVFDAAQRCNTDWLIWLDADTIIQKSFDKELLKQITNKKNLSTHLSVYHEHNNKIYHSCETGFFCLNKTHPKFIDFKKIYTQIYPTDDTNNLRRFYDGEVYGETVNRLDQKYMNNLNPSEKYKTPIKHSILNDYILHYKGKSTKNKTFND